MASFIFEEGTQLNATGFTSSDTLVFKTATPSTLGVSFTPASGTTTDIITLTVGTQSLQFAAAALAGANSSNRLTFLSGGNVSFGFTDATTGADDGIAHPALNATGAAASAAYGFGGNDLINVSGTGAHVVDGGTGVDTVVASGAGAFVVSGGDGADSINATGASGNLHIYGGTFGVVSPTDGADTIVLGTGASYVNGNGGDDSIVATAGSPTGANRLNGGAGNDTFVLSGTLADSVNGNTGNDTIIVNGGSGSLYLRGGQGDDSIDAHLSSGNIQVLGDAGNDTILAGTGINVLTGGAGNDVFVFASGTAGVPAGSGALAGFVTEIKDFVAGTDKIDLAQITSTTTTSTILTKAAGASFTTEADARVYAQQLLDNANATTAQSATVHYTAAIQVGSDTYLYSHEASAATVAIDTVIKLDGVTASSLTKADFI